MVGEHHFSAPGASLLPDTGDPGFGIYLHWPFCAAKCPYCDFNSHVRHRPVDQERFTAAFLREMEHMRALSGPRVVTSIFMGGGTPSPVSYTHLTLPTICSV